MSCAEYLVKHYRLLLLALGIAVLSYGLAAHAVTVQVTAVVIILFSLMGGT